MGLNNADLVTRVLSDAGVGQVEQAASLFSVMLLPGSHWVATRRFACRSRCSASAVNHGAAGRAKRAGRRRSGPRASQGGHGSTVSRSSAHKLKTTGLLIETP